MCGIFATTRPELWESQVEQLLVRMKHRGPDGHGAWTSPSGRVMLLQTRLSIVGLGHEGDQPSIRETSGLTFNGEIYNYRELADANQPLEQLSDTQVFHRILTKEGAAGCDRLRGMFAFAFWNETTGEITYGRDRWGIKPLYVLEHQGGGVSLASELPPLLLHPDAQELDPVGLAQYVAFGHTGPKVTLYRNIRKAEPGVIETRSANGTVRRRIDQMPDTPTLSMEDAMANTVAAHHVADVEVGLFLSGGIDSTLLATYQGLASSTLKTFTIAFPDTPDIDESPLAIHNARLLGTDHHTVAVTVPEMVRSLDTFLGIHGEPFGDSAALPLIVLSAEAARHVKVVLTGEGADEMFGGYRRYDVMQSLNRPVISGVGRVTRPAADLLYRYRNSDPRLRSLEAALRGGGAWGIAALVESDLAAVDRDGPGHAVATALLDDWAGLAGDAAGREGARRFDLSRWLPNTYLEKADRSTMAASLEARTPYLDPIIERAARTPGRAFGKADLRSLLEQRLPGVRLPAVKKGLRTPVPAMLEAGLNTSLRRALDAPDSVLNQYFGAKTVALLKARSSRSSATAYRLAVLGRWQDLTA